MVFRASGLILKVSVPMSRAYATPWFCGPLNLESTKVVATKILASFQLFGGFKARLNNIEEGQLEGKSKHIFLTFNTPCVQTTHERLRFQAQKLNYKVRKSQVIAPPLHTIFQNRVPEFYPCSLPWLLFPDVIRLYRWS